MEKEKENGLSILSDSQVKELNDKDKKWISEGVSIYVNDALFPIDRAWIFTLPQLNKIAFLQYTKKELIKTRDIGAGKKSQYITVRKIERLLNFLFNFNWSSEIIKTDFSEGEQNKKDIYEAYVLLKFNCLFLGQNITRTVSGSFKMFKNPATTKFAVIQAAISQAKRNFAKEFWIGADLNDEDIIAEERFTAIKWLDKEEIEEGMNDLVNEIQKW